jgi:hypothetical protein
MVATAPTIAPSASAAEAAPPLLLPGEHFGAGIAFFLAGALALFWVAPELAVGMYPSPRVIGATHLFTLGWLTLSIWGALYQFLPVALGAGIRWPWLAHGTFALFVPGVAAFVAGLGTGRVGLMAPGAVAVAAAVVGFCVNLWATLGRARRRDLTWWSLLAASVYLLATVVVGGASAGNLVLGYLGASRWVALAVHLHVALAGWVFMVVIGVGSRLLPMFLLSHGSAERWGKAAAALVALGVVLLLGLHHARPVLAHGLPATLIGAGMVAFLVQAKLYYGHRVRPRLDPGLRLAAGGLAVVGIGLVLGVAVMAPGAGGSRLSTAYGAALVLGLSLFVAAHYYKIIPFLVWFHRFGPLVRERDVPTVSGLYDARWAGVAAALLGLGVVGLVASVLVGTGAGSRAAASLFTAGALIETLQMGRLAWKKP